MPIRVEIVSQDRMVYQGDADMVILPGEMGEMGILPNHAPLLSTLKFGILKVRARGTRGVLHRGGRRDRSPTGYRHRPGRCG